MAVTVTDPDVALDGLRSRVDRLLGMDPRMDPGPAAARGADVRTARAYPPGLLDRRALSTDLFAGDNLSHPRTSVRCEGEAVMTVTVTDPDVALDGLQHAALDAARPPIPSSVDRAGCPQIARRRQRHTLGVLAFEVRGGES